MTKPSRFAPPKSFHLLAVIEETGIAIYNKKTGASKPRIN